MDKKFIRVFNEETANMLINCGFTLINNDGYSYIFINDTSKKMIFSNMEGVKFTDIIHM